MPPSLYSVVCHPLNYSIPFLLAVFIALKTRDLEYPYDYIPKTLEGICRRLHTNPDIPPELKTISTWVELLDALIGNPLLNDIITSSLCEVITPTYKEILARRYETHVCNYQKSIQAWNIEYICPPVTFVWPDSKFETHITHTD